VPKIAGVKPAIEMLAFTIGPSNERSRKKSHSVITLKRFQRNGSFGFHRDENVCLRLGIDLPPITVPLIVGEFKHSGLPKESTIIDNQSSSAPY
jgi:hypothetical protein